ncbi:MAG: ribonuclease III [Lachnospiraceae bacterium]|nr:ribonuclease III [Lachnospiraceae bacterium]MBR5357562.1 ribonuclease III [Lachnospiraceae bacterium]
MDELYKKIKEEYGLSDVNPNELAPLILAHIGDAIYEVVIRTITLSKGNRAIEKVHKDATKYVNAKAQADIIEKIQPILTEEELNIYKRGRNAKSNTKAKNASITDYRKATGFEALMGYLYLMDKTDRMLDLIKEGINNGEE